jgi:hypothetical protein
MALKYNISNRREPIRKYNSAMAFASVGAEYKLPPGNSPYSFRKHGQIYNFVSPLYPNEANKPEYGQVYVFDSTEATTKRLENQLRMYGRSNVTIERDTATS